MKDRQKLLDSKIFYFALFSVSAMTVLGSTAIAPALPNLEKHFLDIENIEFLVKLVLTIPAIFIVFFSPISGYLFDRYNRLKLIYPAIIIWSISGVSGFFLDNIYYILISRAIFGIATAFVMTGSSALLADYYTGIKREKALRLQNFYTAFGGTLFLIMGGFLSNINWRYPFLVYILGFVIFIFAFIILFEPQKNKKTSLNHADSNKFNFFTFLPIYMLSFFGMSLFYIVPTQIPFMIINVLHKSGEYVGNSLALSSIVTALTSLLYARIRQYLSLDNMYVLGFSIVGIGLCIINIFHSYFMLLIALICMGFGLAIFLVTNSSWLFSLTNETNRAKAYGFLASSVFIGQFLSPIITQPIVEVFGLINMFLIFGLTSLLIATTFVIKSFIKNKRQTL